MVKNIVKGVTHQDKITKSFDQHCSSSHLYRASIILVLNQQTKLFLPHLHRSLHHFLQFFGGKSKFSATKDGPTQLATTWRKKWSSL